VQDRAKAHPEERFTSLAHHLTPELLLWSYQQLDGKAAPGIDGVSKEEYGRNLSENISDLHDRLKSGKYRATPVKRVYIDKPGGGRRPLGLPTVEDKIVQGAVVAVLNSIYENDFKGFSYGFRPGRSAHQALRSLQTVLQKGRVNWVLDADLSKFFDTIDHKELRSALQRRVTDSRLLRLIGKWLAAGVVEEDGRRIREKRGVPQGGVISPLLANIFLHYALDEFFHQWRKTNSSGEVYIVRYADDFVICFENAQDAKALLQALEERFAGYGLGLNRDKTRLIRFGRQWGKQGRAKSETFDFLGFTHFVGKSRSGAFLVKRKTSRSRLRRSLISINDWCRRHLQLPLWWQWKELNRKLTGHYNYYGVRGNYASLSNFRAKAFDIWLKWLRRRSRQCNKLKLIALLRSRYDLRRPKITHPEGWFSFNPGDLLGRAGCGNSARPDL
jgi:group II intron reverse transcriptase/maturase